MSKNIGMLFDQEKLMCNEAKTVIKLTYLCCSCKTCSFYNCLNKMKAGLALRMYQVTMLINFQS